MNTRFLPGRCILRRLFHLRQGLSGPGPIRGMPPGSTIPVNALVVILFLIVVFGIPIVSAGTITLSTPQSDYYVQTGEEAVIPLTIVSTYDHDVTGTLNLVTIPENSGNTGPGARNTSVQTRAFSAFTDQRTVSLAAGKSDVPADYLLKVSFSYQDAGERSSTLGGIGIHFVTSLENTQKNQVSLVSTDTATPATGTSSSGSAPPNNPGAQSMSAKLQNNQMPQDTSALRNQVAGETNQSGTEKDELLGYIEADPIMASLNRSLAGAGFVREKTDITPVSNRSGSFLLTYSSGTKSAVIRGSVNETHIPFAEESSWDLIPLPDALLDNTSYREYGSRVAEKGFMPNQTRINVTPDRQTVDLTYSDSQNRILKVNAEVQNGTVTAFEGDSPDNPLAVAGPVIALTSVLLLSAGIWYLARFRQKDMPVTAETAHEPELTVSPGEIARHLLGEAESDAARGNYPEAYRKTGRALRIFLSHEISNGDELTSRELERLIGASTGNTEKIRGILDRCLSVGFAKDTPKPGEFQDMIEYCRILLNEGPGVKESPGPDR